MNDDSSLARKTAPVAISSGRLYRPSGDLAARWSFWVIHEETGTKIKGRTDKKGQFRFKALPTGYYNAWSNFMAYGKKHVLECGRSFREFACGSGAAGHHRGRHDLADVLVRPTVPRADLPGLERDGHGGREYAVSGRRRPFSNCKGLPTRWICSLPA